MVVLYASIPFLLFTVSGLIRAEILKLQKQIYILKPVSTLIVIGIALLSFGSPTANLLYTGFILIALTLSFAGDILLIFQQNLKAFRIGLGFFLAAHLTYTAVFSIFGSISTTGAIISIFLIAIDILLYQLFKTNLGRLKIPVIAYLVAISVMLVQAFSTLNSLSLNNHQALMIISGAVLFFISDLILAVNRFWKPWKYNRISLGFYYSGQFLLALSASYFE
jgi:uncharacterized membrane protein YhhN